MNYIGLKILETSAAANLANNMKRISTLVYIALITIAIVVPALVLFLKKHGIKELTPQTFNEKGMYILGDSSLRKTFVSIRKVDDKLVFVANEYTKKANVSIVNFSCRKKTTSYKLDFTKGSVIEISIPKETRSITIVPESTNGIKAVGAPSVRPSTGTNVLCSLLPAFLITCCCLYETLTMSFVLSAPRAEMYNVSAYFFYSFLPLLIGFPALFAALQFFSKKVRK